TPSSACLLWLPDPNTILPRIDGSYTTPRDTTTWAIGFYESHGFSLVPEEVIAPLLKAYWNVPERQIATSVVLATPALTIDGAASLIANASPPDRRMTGMS
ncbi:hypothetical protein ACQKO5_19870, partial [Novosphingobium subterraneum]